jgi:hypothetical protein
LPKVNKLDKNYDQPKYKMRTLKETEKDFTIINTYIQNTSAGRRLTLINVFEIECKGEKQIFNPKKLSKKSCYGMEADSQTLLVFSHKA